MSPSVSARSLCLISLLTLSPWQTDAAPPGRSVLRARLRLRLIWAMTQKNEGELGRVAMNLGTAALSQALDSRRDRPLRMAAIAATTTTSQSWGFLPKLLRIARKEPDRLIAAAAARAAREISEGLRPADLLRYEQRDAVRTLIEPLLRAAYDRTLSPDIRVSLIMCLAQLGSITPLPSRRMEPLLKDKDQQIRRAAVELFVGTAEGRPILIASLADASATVRLGAAAALCANLPLEARARRRILRSLGKRPVRKQLVALWRSGGPKDERLDLARCLTKIAPGTLRRRGAR